MANMCYINIFSTGGNIYKKLKERPVKDQAGDYWLTDEQCLFDVQFGSEQCDPVDTNDGSCWGETKWCITYKTVIDVITMYDLDYLELSYEEDNAYGNYLYEDGIVYDRYIPENHEVFTDMETDGDVLDSLLKKQTYSVIKVIKFVEDVSKLSKLYITDVNKELSLAQLQIDAGWTPSEHLKDIEINGETIWQYYCNKQLEKL